MSHFQDSLRQRNSLNVSLRLEAVNEVHAIAGGLTFDQIGAEDCVTIACAKDAGMPSVEIGKILKCSFSVVEKYAFAGRMILEDRAKGATK